MADNFIYEEGFAAYFSGNMSKAELTKLHAWRKEDASHEKAFKEAEKLWELSRQNTSNFLPDIETAWARFEESIDFEQDEPDNIRPFFAMRSLARLAAVLLVGVGFIYWLLQPNARPPEMMAIQTLTGETQEVLLPDGSTVFLNQSSKLSYPSEFSEREVVLEGEAFFEVEKAEGKTFSIQSGATRTTVLGTAFNVRAYAQEGQVLVAVKEGKVAFAHEKKTPVTLEAGNMAVFNKETKELEKIEAADPNSDAWKTGKLTFNNTPLKKVSEVLAKQFGVDMQVEANMLSCPFTGNFEKDNLSQGFEALKFGLGATVSTKENVFVVSGACK